MTTNEWYPIKTLPKLVKGDDPIDIITKGKIIVTSRYDEHVARCGGSGTSYHSEYTAPHWMYVSESSLDG